jgi:hypothetical protein
MIMPTTSADAASIQATSPLSTLPSGWPAQACVAQTVTHKPVIAPRETQ